MGSTNPTERPNDTADREATNAFTSEGGRMAGAPDEHTMAEFGVRFDGRHYRYENQRYDRLEDALAYARLQRDRRAAAPGTTSSR